MRRMSLALLALAALVLVTAADRPLSAQSQDSTVANARQLLDRGSYDAAITVLRDALAARRADRTLRLALADALEVKRAVLSEQVHALADEITALRATPASKACDSRAPVRVGDAIKAPMRTNHVNAAYPAEAMRQRVEGTVVLEIVVGCDGAVTDARVLRGIPMLDAAAVDAVKQWRFQPTLLNGAPVPVVSTVTVTFTLRD